MYPAFKNDVLGQKLLTVQGITNPYGVECVTLGWAYANYLFPDVSIKDTITLGNANTLGSYANANYFQKIMNDVNDINQVPQQGDIMVFGGTPAPGYTNQFTNPDGHTGIYDGPAPGGYNLLQQNAPNSGASVNVTAYNWKFRPCLCWLRPIGQHAVSAPVPVAAPQTVTLPKGVSTWAAYRVGSLLRKGTSDQVGTLLPSVYGPLVYDIISWVGNYAVNIKTADFGEVTIWVRDTPAVIS
jgi:hypothetical protein